MARTQAADYEQRREAIVDHAAKLFAEMGFARAAMSDLAQACEMSKSLLYHYYGSKEELLYAVMLSHVDLLLYDVDCVVQRDTPPREKLGALIHAFMRHYIGAAERQKVLLNELDSLPRDKREIIVQKQRAIVDAVQKLFSDATGFDESPARARARTMLLFGMINWTHTWFDPKGAVGPDELAEMVIETVSARG